MHTRKWIFPAIGLAIFLCLVIFPNLNQRKAVAQFHVLKPLSDNLFTNSLKQDSETISQQVGYTGKLKLEAFDLDYYPDGKIKTLFYHLIGDIKGQMVITTVSYDNNSYSYYANVISGPYLQYPVLLDATKLFDVLSKVNFVDMKANGDYEFYGIRSGDNIAEFKEKGHWEYIVANGKVRELSEKDFPIQGIYLMSYGWQKVNEGHYTATAYKNYLIDLNNL